MATKNSPAHKNEESRGQATDPSGEIKKDGRKDPNAVVKDMDNKSKAIRALNAAGYTTAEIVKLSKGDKGLKILQYKDGREIRYQHVRNVLVQPVKDVG